MPKLNGSRVRHRIAELDMEMESFAEKFGISYGTLRNATRDRNSDPMSLLRAYRLARFLGLPPEEVLANDDSVPGESPSHGRKPARRAKQSAA